MGKKGAIFVKNERGAYARGHRVGANGCFSLIFDCLGGRLRQVGGKTRSWVTCFCCSPVLKAVMGTFWPATGMTGTGKNTILDKVVLETGEALGA